MNKMIIIPAIAVSAIIMGSALADAKPNRLRKFTDEKKEPYPFIFTNCNIKNTFSFELESKATYLKKSSDILHAILAGTEYNNEYLLDNQGNSISNRLSIFKSYNDFNNIFSSANISKENCIQKRHLLEMLDITGAGAVGQLSGSILGGCAGLGISYCIYGNNKSNEIDGIGRGVAIISGAAIGGLLGNSIFTYRKGKEYRNGSYLFSLLGSFLPSITVAYIKSQNIFSKNNIIYYTWFCAPITASSTYYVFSKPKNK